MSPAPAEVGARRGSRLDAVRAYGVMVGGPVLLLLAVVASIGFTIWSLAQGERPSWLALAGVVALTAYVVVLRPWSRRWGTSPDERRMTLPGDEQVPRPGVAMTRAVTIDAPPERVWPWIAQIGQDRGGFYSYTFLENLAGCRMRNADRIHPEWQHRAVGDTVPLHPMAGIELSRFEPNRSYALQGWYFALEPTDGDRTRLLARSRIPPGATSAAYALFIELPHFVMERKMLLGIKQRAEA
jgi:hypothetical protein